MKSLNIKLPFTVNDLLSLFDKLDTRDLQSISDKLSNLISKRNSPSPKDRETQLLSIINNKLSPSFFKRYHELKAKMELGMLDKSTFPELEAYVEKIETVDTQKIEALKDLAKLRKVSFQQLAIDLAVFPRTNE